MKSCYETKYKYTKKHSLSYALGLSKWIEIFSILINCVIPVIFSILFNFRIHMAKTDGCTLHYGLANAVFHIVMFVAAYFIVCLIELAAIYIFF